ncbi:TIGR03746 family integrating conjugative element protein [Rouxiella badensis]|uniref:PFL_4703 family integrating conjugative element protein n=1 Tax=Rouxiella badensis TaxID=1646377 RepID=UPI001D13CF16|nr:TIGR03746 family integrating conjugative element protein [Rouxiella badensis]MCC3701664.1 TIGR03746 family integrating conjugative element protein [Rouxiella badensis]
MSRFRHAIKNRDQHIFTLRMACGMLTFFLLLALAGWTMAPRSLMIYNPPDLRSGSTRAWWEIPPSSVYTFAFYIFQQLNAWPKNGEKDYPAKIEALSAYLTPACHAFLKIDAKKRTDSSELTDRVRVVYELPGHGFSDRSVSVHSRNSWTVRLDLVADEYFLTEPVKRALTRYPLKIVRWGGDAERNPFGLAVDCYDGVPQRLEGIASIQLAEQKGKD